MDRRRILVGLVLVAAAAGAGFHLISGEDTGAAPDRPATIQEALEGVGWNVTGMSGWAVDEYTRGTINGISSVKFRATGDSTIVRVWRLTDIGNGTATGFMDDQRSRIAGRFRKTPEPYAASPTPDVRCPEGFLPVEEQHPDGIVLTNMSASSTRSFPTCDRSAVTHQVTVRLLHCPSARSFVRMVTYTPVGQDEPAFSISCPS